MGGHRGVFAQDAPEARPDGGRGEPRMRFMRIKHGSYRSKGERMRIRKQSWKDPLPSQQQLYRRRPRIKRLEAPCATRLVTWNRKRGRDRLLPEERTLVVQALRYFDGSRYRLRGYVAMDDHVHVLIDTFAEFSLASLLHSWKSYTAHEFIKRGYRTTRTWQRSAYDSVIVSKIRLYNALRYIENNPRRRWGATVQYPWLWIEP